MNIAIVGFDREGKASYDYYRRLGATVTVFDENTSLQTPDPERDQLGIEAFSKLQDFDMVLRTPGLHPAKLRKYGVETATIWSGTNEFFKVCPTRNIIGVTGTKGKGTTSTLIAKMLQKAGHKVHLGGNIGIPALTLLDEDIRPEDWVVLELSNYQLIDMQASPHIAVCLLVVPEHLDWHADEEEYIAAKTSLFEWQNSDDVAIYYAENARSKAIAQAGAGRKLPYYASPGAWVNGNIITIDGQEICTTDELKLLGTHNWQNVCAALTAVWQTGVRDIAAIRSVLTTFTGLEHRLELVRELDSVRYYDDSFGTTPETAIVALQAFEAPKVLILGGSDKGALYDALAAAVTQNNVRSVILIGDQAERIKRALATAGYTATMEGCQNMTEILAAARQAAQPGDVVLLSTGCASFGMFTDYKDRGNQFKAAVQALA